MKSDPARAPAFWLVLAAAAGTFALVMGTPQTMGLFVSPLNTATGLGGAALIHLPIRESAAQQWVLAR